MKLKKGLNLILDYASITDNDTCGNGASVPVFIEDAEGNVLWSDTTCPCGRGCGNKACIRDDWGYHDTDIEEFREDSHA